MQDGESQLHSLIVSDSSAPLSECQHLKTDQTHSLLHHFQFIIHKSYHTVAEKS